MINNLRTLYNGVSYRNEAVARWAAFLHKAGAVVLEEPVAYAYEGDLFVADFWLPSSDCYLLIDRPAEHADALCTATKKKSISLPRRPMLFEIGDSAAECQVLTCWLRIPGKLKGVEESESGHLGHYAYYLFCICPHCGLVGIEFHGRSDRLMHHICPKSEHGDKGYTEDHPKLIAAFDYANSLHFTGPCLVEP